MANLSSLVATARTANYGPFVPADLRLSVPLETTKPKLDNLIAHDSRVDRREPQGFFCGSPVFLLDKRGMDVDALVDAKRLVDMQLVYPNTAEVLPGESICDDNVVRRTTTAEHRGDAFYEQLEENIVEGNSVSLEAARLAAREGAMVTWFKDHAIVHEEVACE